MLLYPELRDTLFGVIGTWGLMRCKNRDCGLLWLDPMPVEEDLHEAYSNYYTHTLICKGGKLNYFRKYINMLDQCYLNSKFHYRHNRIAAVLGKVLYLLPIRRRNLEVGIRYLDRVPGGKVLDVGCGAGGWLRDMKDRGWEGYGVDFDKNAVKVATADGIFIKSGRIEDQAYPSEFFDAVTLNHVIEHLPDPCRTVEECLRVLKPGGKCIIITPNGESLGHRVFGCHWRGIEAPRHLHIFSFESLKKVLDGIEAKTIVLKPQVVQSLPYESFILLCENRYNCNMRIVKNIARIFTYIFNGVEQCIIWLVPSLADCIVAIIEKKK